MLLAHNTVMYYDLKLFTLFLKIYLFEGKNVRGESAQMQGAEGEGERESQRDLVLSTEPASGLDLRSLRS